MQPFHSGESANYTVHTAVKGWQYILASNLIKHTVQKAGRDGDTGHWGEGSK